MTEEEQQRTFRDGFRDGVRLSVVLGLAYLSGAVFVWFLGVFP